MEFLNTLDHEAVCTNPADLRAHGVEHGTEILDMRFTGGVIEHGDTLSQGGGHDQVFGGSDTGFIQEDIGAGQTLGGFKAVGATCGNGGSKAL